MLIGEPKHIFPRILSLYHVSLFVVYPLPCVMCIVRCDSEGNLFKMSYEVRCNMGTTYCVLLTCEGLILLHMFEATSMFCSCCDCVVLWGESSHPLCCSRVLIGLVLCLLLENLLSVTRGSHFQFDCVRVET